jgi:signal peptidase
VVTRQSESQGSRRGTSRRAGRLGTALTVLVCTAAGALLALAVLGRSDGAGVSRVAGHPVLTVLSDSMSPTFRAGDMLVDSPVSGTATTLAVGDVITYRASGSDALITHRIVSIETGPEGTVAYRTQGDANNAPDPALVSPEQVVGTYSAHVPLVGYALDAAHSRQGLFLLIVIPALALLLPELRKWWQAEPAPATESIDPHAARASHAEVAAGTYPARKEAPTHR